MIYIGVDSLKSVCRCYETVVHLHGFGCQNCALKSVCFRFPHCSRMPQLVRMTAVMKHFILGHTGLTVSEPCLGRMTLAQPGFMWIIIGTNKLVQSKDLKSAELALSPPGVGVASAGTAPRKLYPQGMIELVHAGRIEVMREHPQQNHKCQAKGPDAQRPKVTVQASFAFIHSRRRLTHIVQHMNQIVCAASRDSLYQL
jgi:hypothetical protein